MIMVPHLCTWLRCGMGGVEQGRCWVCKTAVGDQGVRYRHLLERMLVVDPLDRFSVNQILQHPWFLVDLPPNALRMNDFYRERSPHRLNKVLLSAAVLRRTLYTRLRVALHPGYSCYCQTLNFVSRGQHDSWQRHRFAQEQGM